MEGDEGTCPVAGSEAVRKQRHDGLVDAAAAHDGERLARSKE